MLPRQVPHDSHEKELSQATTSQGEQEEVEILGEEAILDK